MELEEARPLVVDVQLARARHRPAVAQHGVDDRDVLPGPRVAQGRVEQARRRVDHQDQGQHVGARPPVADHRGAQDGHEADGEQDGGGVPERGQGLQQAEVAHPGEPDAGQGGQPEGGRDRQRAEGHPAGRAGRGRRGEGRAQSGRPPGGVGVDGGSGGRCPRVGSDIFTFRGVGHGDHS